MKEAVRCCFAGHSDLYGRSEEIVNKIMNTAEDLIIRYGVNEFWVGNYGSFDGCSASAIIKLKKNYPNILLELVIPYLTMELIEYKNLYDGKFDNILVADIPENKPKRFHIRGCNEYMVNNSNFLICCIDHTWGGAYGTYTFAKQKKKRIFNIADNPIKE